MTKEIGRTTMESQYKPQYRNLSFGADNALYNKCQDVLIYLYNRYYGSALSVSSIMVLCLRENIKLGNTTLTKYKKDFGELAYLCNCGKIKEAEKYMKEHPWLKI